MVTAMAGFLRRRNKEDVPLKPIPSAPIPLGTATASPPPLFARFATSTKSSIDITPNHRIVSSPMVLSSNPRKELPQRVKANGPMDAAAKKRTTQNQALNKALPPVQPARSDQQPLLAPAFQDPISDKPLPPPFLPPSSLDLSGPTLTQSWLKQSRPTFQNQPQGRPRDNVGNKESKQSTRPPSSQSFYPGQASNTDESLISNQASRLPTTNNAPLTSPPRRNSAVSSTNLNPQILPSTIANQKMPPNSLASSGRQILPTTAQTQTSHLFQRSVANQDLHPVNININGNMSMIGGPPSKRMDIQPSLQGTPISDRVVDLPPEFALFQEFSQFTLEDRSSVYSSRRTPNNNIIINANENVVLPSNVPRSSTYSEGRSITPRPSTILLGPSQENLLSTHPPQSHSEPHLPPTPPPSSTPPPPPPPPQSKSGMGVASSQAIGNDFLPSSMKDLSSPRVLTNANPRTSLYNNFANQPQMLLNRRDHSNSPPLPPPRTAPHLPNSDMPPSFPARSEIPSNRMQTVPPRRPSIQDFQQPSSRKSVNLQGPTVPMKGKPRIFAAMAAQEEDELDQLNVSPLPLGPPQHVHQPVVKKRPSQSTMHVQQLQSQNQTSVPELGAYTNGSDPVKADLTRLSSTQPPVKADLMRFSSPQSQPQPQPQPPTSSTPKISNHVLEQLPSTPPSHSTSRSSRLNGAPPRSVLKQDELPQSQLVVPQTPPRNRKKSKPRTPSEVVVVSSVQVHHHHHPNGSTTTIPGTPESYHRGTNGSVRTLTKSRPTTPVAAPLHKPSLFTSPKHGGVGASLESAVQVDEDIVSNVGIPLDDDPFASVEGVTLLRPSTSNSLKEKEKENDGNANANGKKHRNKQSSQGPSISSQQSSLEEGPEGNEKKKKKKNVVATTVVNIESETVSAVVEIMVPPTPISPPQEQRKTKKKQHDDDDNDNDQTESTPAPPLPAPVDGEDAVADADADYATAAEEEEEPEPEPEPVPQITMVQFLSDPQLLSSLLTFFSFYDWCVLVSLSKEIRTCLVRTPVLRETVLERFLRTVGYSRWIWGEPDPLSLSLQDLNDYMRGVSTPTHEYARVAGMYVHSLTVHPNHRDPSLLDTIRILTNSTRAYTRVVLRLRAQAEKEASLAQQYRGGLMVIKPPSSNNNYHSSSSSSPARGGTNSRVSSRAPSPTTSSYSHSHSHSYYHGGNGSGGPTTTNSSSSSSSQTGSLNFRSPLFKLRRAPLLRVFVPSPEGDWLSDKSVLACETECRRANVMQLMRAGDVVWDVAVGDEGNVGRLVWDGSYLIDLDYTYSSIGDLPKYMPALAFPPSYFHRVIRTGPIISNPIVHIDISPWGEEIAMNLQLLQDRVRTETPQGAYHNVVRWVHRSSFVIRQPRIGAGGGGSTRYIQQGAGASRTQIPVPPRIPIPETDNLFVDSGWYGTIVVETEGTNEALADLQERCGRGVFPPRTRGVGHHQTSQAQIENKKVFRILREKSRPSEIWIKAIGIKERIL